MFKGNGLLMTIFFVLLCTYFIYKKVKFNDRVIQRPIIENTQNDTIHDNKPFNNDTYSDSMYSISYLTGKFEPSKEISFAKIDIKYANREGLYLREEAYGAFIKMQEAALKDGVKLIIISATRNFNYQKGIWEGKWTGKRLVDGKNLSVTEKDPVERAKTILKYSAMPGTSRHHWGSDIDLNSMENSYFASESGKKIYDWLCNNAEDYGFCQPYIKKGEIRPVGYEEEKWHWSYMPVAGKCLEEYKEKVGYNNITGFSGNETAEELNVIKDYVFGINPGCK